MLNYTCWHCGKQHEEGKRNPCEDVGALDGWERRVRQLEDEGLTRSDAQAVADVERII